MATQANCLPMNKVKLLNLKIILKMYKIMFISFAYLEFIKLFRYIYIIILYFYFYQTNVQTLDQNLPLFFHFV